MSKVVKIEHDIVHFDTQHTLYSDHDQDCCESHYLSFKDLSVDDFEGLEFNLDGEFFERVEDFGIRLLPTNGQPIPVPGYGYNNGYYSSNLTLVLCWERGQKSFDISECQEILE
ncbi:hypothetical protein [Stenotrophomonas maltophilia]|uniref:hypothetical protein n=1 Tax=Stenotrophomonas maltophilia TaxID=40324 RepID=UPI002E77D451|nr:hypothetical protein [Stenotrophomonas maltophilia]